METVILASRSEATRGLFWDGPRNFEPLSGDALAGSQSPNFRTTHTAVRLASYAGFSVQQAQYTTDLQWNRVSGLEPSGPRAGTLPLGHRGLNYRSASNFGQNSSSGSLSVSPWIYEADNLKTRGAR
ncbi:hypothetical protein AVEN_74042-1 [Araneus ventricosus]|uniref:Uncharacterized protein n=1 Tax=Araneus ventricosus TaxID=182803 RepID=A0A4Y2J187_ARAVE|nr:hypothetical protein AVEN_74042-1 [Araneus ventricosus]